MNVLPVPALASSTVVPVGSGPQTSNGNGADVSGCPGGAYSRDIHVLDVEDR